KSIRARCSSSRSLRRNCAGPMNERSIRARASDHLVATAAEIPDRRTPDVHEPREREHEKDRHAEEKMRLEDRMHDDDECGDTWPQREYALRPGHEFHHLMAVEMPERHEDRGKAEHQLPVEQK